MSKNEKQKIIFLDVDGVICLYPEWQQGWMCNENDRLNELCCKNLKSVLDATGARIVITSSWRLAEMELTNLYAQAERFGLSCDYFIGVTTNLIKDKNLKTHNAVRAAEIKAYIAEHEIESYVILDDFNLENHDKAHLIKTKRHEGLTAKLRDVCIMKLS